MCFGSKSESKRGSHTVSDGTLDPPKVIITSSTGDDVTETKRCSIPLSDDVKAKNEAKKQDDSKKPPKSLKEELAEQRRNRKWWQYRPGDNGGLNVLGDL